MPRPTSPPTPQASTEISSKQDGHAMHIDGSFVLPPAAINSGSREGTSSSTTSNASDSSYRPASPTLTKQSSPPNPRKRSSASLHAPPTQDGYTLPPPPTRSRKIIQMKPKSQQQQPSPMGPEAMPSPEDEDLDLTPTSATKAGGAGSKKKQANGSTAAGRKIARKTAHSLIERRRRSKMNEEFGVLKDMIPACAGQEMHKLAILQASIEYMRYLEQCVTDLKDSHKTSADMTPRESSNATPLAAASNNSYEDDSEEDEDMSDAISPTTMPHQRHTFPSLPPSATTSPTLYARDDRNPYSTHPHSSTTSPAIQPGSDPRHYSMTSSIRSTATSPSILPSPAFRTGNAHAVPPFGAGSAPRFAPLTSPALRPQTSHSSVASIHASQPEDERVREDHEATAALLMLNSDRRNWAGRGMSVKDLLSG